MTLLTILGMASMLFVTVFTWWSYRSGVNPRAAIIEAWAGVVIGFGINFIANFFILPLAGASISVSQNFWMGWVYTSISILRQYAIRRWFQQKLHQASQVLARPFSTEVNHG